MPLNAIQSIVNYLKQDNMVGLSRQEINLRRLLAKCELMCKNQKDDERFQKYVNTLEDMLQDVKKHSQ